MRVIVSIVTLAICAGLVPGKQRGSLLQQAPAHMSEIKNPYDADPDAVRAGTKLYLRECAACHGRNSKGIGQAPPLASHAVRDASAGTLFWVLTNGSAFHGMPSFSHVPEQRRWQIIAYLKSL